MMTYGGIPGSILLVATDKDAYHHCLNLNFACYFVPNSYSQVWVSSKVSDPYALIVLTMKGRS